MSWRSQQNAGSLGGHDNGVRTYTTRLLLLLAIAFVFPAIVVVAEHAHRPLWPYFRASVGTACLLAIAIVVFRSAALLRDARWPHALIAAPVALALVVGLGRINQPWPPSSAKRRALQAEGLVLVQQLEAFRAKQGRYPDTPALAGVSLPATEFGAWSYACVRDCADFRLSVGDYAHDGFQLVWRSDTRAWSWDS